jgi:polysaccharide biosynthesis transport protein
MTGAGRDPRAATPSARAPQDHGGDGAPGFVIGDYLQIQDYIAILVKRRWVIAGILALGLAAGFAYNWQAPRIYQAAATLQIEVDPNVLGLDRPMLDRQDWMREFLPTQVAILMSGEVAQMAHEDLVREAAGREVATNEIGEDGATTSPTVPSVGDIIGGRVGGVVKDTRLVNVGFRSTDPELAARVANALARAYARRSVDTRSSTLGEASEWLERQVEDQRKLVQASEAALQRYREQHGADALITDSEGNQRQNIVVQKLAELQAAATRARAETIEKESVYRQVRGIDSSSEALDSVPAVASNAYFQSLRAELANAQRQLAQAASELGELHPDMIKLRNAVQDAQRKLQAETGKVVRSIRHDYEAAQARERALLAALERQKAETQTLNAKAIEYTALLREATANREALDKLLQRSREASLASGVQTTHVRVVDAAKVPGWPALPRTNRNLMLSLVGSSAFAFALIFLLEIFNTRVNSPDEVKRHLGIRVLGVTPEVKLQLGGRSLLVGGGAPPVFAELLDMVRTNLLLAPSLATTSTLLITSSQPGEGKTTAAANLAISLARLNQRVLLIDADLRKPRLHELFGVTQGPGLSDVLVEKPTQAAFRETKVPRLWLMPSGRPPGNPTDLLGSERFAKMIDWLRGQFDWVLLDSPPVLAVTDACLIAPTVSGVLFVVGAGVTPRAVAAAAVERLDAVGANVVGAMLNRVALDAPGNSYLPYYHKEYGGYYVPSVRRASAAAPPATPSGVRGDQQVGRHESTVVNSSVSPAGRRAGHVG